MAEPVIPPSDFTQVRSSNPDPSRFGLGSEFGVGGLGGLYYGRLGQGLNAFGDVPLSSGDNIIRNPRAGGFYQNLTDLPNPLLNFYLDNGPGSISQSVAATQRYRGNVLNEANALQSLYAGTSQLDPATGQMKATNRNQAFVPISVQRGLGSYDLANPLLQGEVAFDPTTFQIIGRERELNPLSGAFMGYGRSNQALYGRPEQTGAGAAQAWLDRVRSTYGDLSGLPADSLALENALVKAGYWRPPSIGTPLSPASPPEFQNPPNTIGGAPLPGDPMMPGQPRYPGPGTTVDYGDLGGLTL